MANKFLGLDSINVLTSYIDQAVSKKSENALVLTIQAYKYAPNGETPEIPTGGGFDFNFGAIQWPEGGWSSLKDVLEKIGDDLENALYEGSIYVSSAVVTGKNSTSWSRPMRISGQNGVSVKFKYAYDVNATTWTDTPSGVNVNNRVEYVWTKEGEGEWTGPTIWAMYSEDASNVLWRYCVTNTLAIPPKPTVGDSNWSTNLINRNLSKEYPYMWMSSQIVPAGQDAHDGGWSEPILFGHWGMDGNVPDYNVTLYAIGGNLDIEGSTPGMVKPEQPKKAEGEITYDDFRTANPTWKELPEDDETVWWQCTIKVNGQTGNVMEIGAVKRYNAVDGNALPGQFTLFMYRWSENQSQPQFDTTDMTNGVFPNGWFDTFDYENGQDYTGDKFSHLPESSLWMISAVADGYNNDGYPNIREWSSPVKITGPRGPIAYDYRVEVRYNIGTSEKPKALPNEEEWMVTPPTITSTYPYVWGVNYLVCYKMRYDTDKPNVDGSFPVVEADNGTIVDHNNDGYFRVSGLDGEDGNKKNSIDYTTESKTVSVTSFSQTNLFISNSDEDTTYTIALDQLSFIDGYTGKFCNIGKGNMTINSNTSMPLVASCTSATSVVLAPQESVELVCHNNGKDKELILIGKELTESVTE